MHGSVGDWSTPRRSSKSKKALVDHGPACGRRNGFTYRGRWRGGAVNFLVVHTPLGVRAARVAFRQGRLVIVSPDSLGTTCQLSGTTYRPVQISGTGSIFHLCGLLAGGNGCLAKGVSWLHSLQPIRTHVGADYPVFRAHHLRPQRGHCDVAREMVDVHDHLVQAPVTLKGERPPAVLARGPSARSKIAKTTLPANTAGMKTPQRGPGRLVRRRMDHQANLSALPRQLA
jgi:hypothetical protein